MCGRCGRRVPRSVPVCRCGAAVAPLSEDAGGANPARDGSGLIVRSVIAAALGGAAVVLAFLWVNQPAPEPAPQPAVATAARGPIEGSRPRGVTPEAPVSAPATTT